MYEIEIEIFKASYGESYLVTLYGEEIIRILIDMGLEETYEQCIKPRLQEIAKQDGIIDILILTHIDADHIGGALRFLDDNGDNDEPKIIKVNDIWYNAYRHLSFSKRDGAAISRMQKIILEGKIFAGMEKSIKKYCTCNAVQGAILSVLILKGNYSWNNSFGGHAVMIGAKPKKYTYKNLEFVLLSPSLEDLIGLEKSWREELLKLGVKDISDEEVFDKVFEVLLLKEHQSMFYETYIPIAMKSKKLREYNIDNKYVDQSKVNRSSIAFEIKFKNRRLLFLGDAHKKRIQDSLIKLYGKNNTEWYDFIKVSHHGSNGNIDKELLTYIDSSRFSISTDGKRFNHPNIETIARIVCREIDGKRSLIFNYEEIKEKYDVEEWKNDYKYEVNEVGKQSIIVTI